MVSGSSVADGEKARVRVRVRARVSTPGLRQRRRTRTQLPENTQKNAFADPSKMGRAGYKCCLRDEADKIVCREYHSNPNPNS